MTTNHLPAVTLPRTAGFSLVETLVSLALLGLTAATVLSLLVRSGLNNLEARRAEALVEMARSSVAEVDGAGHLAQVWCPSVAAWREDCGDEAPQFRRVVRAAPVLEPGLPGESVEILDVAVEVIALQAGRAAGERRMSLVTLRQP